MNDDAMVFAMANPTPEVSARGGGGVRPHRGDGPLGLPQPDQQRAVLPGHLPRRAGRARADDHRGDEDGGGAGHRRPVDESELREDYIIPSVFNRDVSPAVAAAVAEQAKEQGAAMAAGDTIGFAAIDAERMRSS